jgi:hypothetical protein
MLQLPAFNFDITVAKDMVILMVNGNTVNDQTASPVLLHSIQQCSLLLLLGNLILV